MQKNPHSNFVSSASSESSVSSTIAMDALVSPDTLRSQFSTQLSALYQAEVPQYAQLLQIVASVNQGHLEKNPEQQKHLFESGDLARLGLERHGAIRLGTALELRNIARMFALMGMQPVGYYDLSVAGVPVHSTAFRPVGREALARNPLRIFTSLLRLDLIEDPALAQRAQAILSRRHIMTEELLALMEQGEQAGGFTPHEAQTFCGSALEVFRWHTEAIVDAQTYQALHAAHRLIADVVCFKGPHINHLTPRTLDIDAAQHAMKDAGLSAKAVIEGPPRRAHPILLRQTSFQALTEPVAFLAGENNGDGNGMSPTAGAHTARFGEIEQRGMALTPKGRALYDALLEQARQSSSKAQSTSSYQETYENAYENALQTAFQAFPDDAVALRQERLAYFYYQATGAAVSAEALALIASERDDDNLTLMDTLINAGCARAEPIVYEDFLPVSAAGIFRSNLGEGGTEPLASSQDQAQFERDLGRAVLDPFDLYEALQQDSIRACLARLRSAT